MFERIRGCIYEGFHRSEVTIGIRSIFGKMPLQGSRYILNLGRVKHSLVNALKPSNFPQLTSNMLAETSPQTLTAAYCPHLAL